MCRKPAACVTPKRDREMYILNKRDLNHMKKLLQEANNMILYYANMPENRTGELGAMSVDLLQEVQEMAHDFHTMIDDVEYLE